MAKQSVALSTVTSGDRVERARTSLADALGDAQLGDVDDAGVFDVAVDAESPDAARELVREAFARAGTGDDFVIREMDPSDPRPGPAPDGGESGARSTVADAASAVAAAASSGDTQAARDAADAARTAAGDAADAVREAASSAREAVDDKGVAGAASDYASTAATAAQRDWSRYAPVGGLFLVLLLLRRGRR